MTETTVKTGNEDEHSNAPGPLELEVIAKAVSKTVGLTLESLEG
jgi:hypothetical protein